MAVVSRIATLTFLSAPGTSSRTWQATAAVQDTAAGGSVVITTVQSTTGALFPAEADTLTLSVYNDGGALIRAFTLNPSLASQTSTFHFTADGLSTGAARAGTVELAIRATKTTGGPTATYDYETDGSPATPPATFTASVVDRGWIRGTTTLVESISNIALGGGKNSPAEYDESLHVRLTAGAVSYIAHSLTVALSNTTPALSGVTNSTTAVTRDVSFASVCDARFPAATTTTQITVTVPNATLTGLPRTVFTAITDDSIAVDPRLTFEHLLQEHASAFATPPLSSANAVGQRVFPAVCYLSTNVRGSRGTRVGNVVTGGRNGLDIHVAFVASATGQDFPGDFITATKGGEAGWHDMLVWTAAIAGVWTKTVTLGPTVTDLTNAYLVNATGVTYLLLAENPAIKLRPYVNKVGTAPRRHFTAGETILANFFVEDTDSMKKVPASRITVPQCSVRHRNPNTQKLYFLKSDTATTFATAWEEWDGIDEVCTYFPMTESVGTAGFYVKTFAATQAWDRDISIAFLCRVDGTPYSEAAHREETGDINPHDTVGTLDGLADVATTGADDGEVLTYVAGLGLWVPVVGGGAVSPADIAAITNAVWDEATAEARVAGSYGQLVKDRVDATISSRVATADARLVNLDAAVSSRATAAALTALAAALADLDAQVTVNLDVAVSTRMPASASYGAEVT